MTHMYLHGISKNESLSSHIESKFMLSIYKTESKRRPLSTRKDGHLKFSFQLNKYVPLCLFHCIDFLTSVNTPKNTSENEGGGGGGVHIVFTGAYVLPNDVNHDRRCLFE